MFKVVPVSSDNSRVRMIDDRYLGSIYLTPEGHFDTVKLVVSGDFKSKVALILDKEHSEVTSNNNYRWLNVTGKDIWRIQHYFLYN